MDDHDDRADPRLLKHGVRMTMEYGLTRPSLDSATSVAISEGQFNALIQSHEGLSVASGFEQKYVILLENFEELERDRMGLTVTARLFDRPDYGMPFRLITRRVINLLTAARLYVDQTKCGLSRLFGKASTEYLAFNQATNQAYAEFLGYRVMEALRNYAQHRDLPVHGLTWEHWRDDPGDDAPLFSTLVPGVDPAVLRQDRRVKAAVVTELEERGGGKAVPLSPLAAEYIEGLGRVHTALQLIIEPHIKAWSEEITRALEAWPGAGGETGPIYAARREGGGPWEYVSHLPPPGAFLKLRDQCRPLKGFARSVITSAKRRRP